MSDELKKPVRTFEETFCAEQVIVARFFPRGNPSPIDHVALTKESIERFPIIHDELGKEGDAN